MHFRCTTLALDEPLVLVCYNPSLHRFMATVSESVETLTSFNRLYYDHCWTTGSLDEIMSLNSTESRTGFGIQLPFTARQLVEAPEVELNCNQPFGVHCRGLVGQCILTVNQLQLTHENVFTDCTWKGIYTDETLPIRKKNKFTAQVETEQTDSTGKVNVKITGLPISSDEVTVTVTGCN